MNFGRVVMVLHLDPVDVQKRRNLTGSKLNTVTTLPRITNRVDQPAVYWILCFDVKEKKLGETI